jgi:hypothetical protein
MNELITVKSASKLKKHPAMNGKKPGPGSRKDPKFNLADAYMHKSPKMSQKIPLKLSAFIFGFSPS